MPEPLPIGNCPNCERQVFDYSVICVCGYDLKETVEQLKQERANREAPVAQLPKMIMAAFEKVVDPPRTFNIIGLVKSLSSGAPLENAHVRGTIEGKPIFDAVTDRDGRFSYQGEMSHHTEDRIQLHVEHADHNVDTQEKPVGSGDIALEFGLLEKPRPCVTISGVVNSIDPTEPIAGATVTGSVGAAILFTVQTDSRGEFFHRETDPSLANKRMELEVKHPHFATHLRHELIAAPNLVLEINLKSADPVPEVDVPLVPELMRDSPVPEPGTATLLRPAPSHSTAVVVTGGKRSRGLWLAMGSAAMVVMAALGYLMWPTATVAVPDIVGHSIEEVERELTTLKLVRGSVTQVRTSDQKPDTVIATSPEKGTSVPVGASVDLTIAIADLVEVPELRTLSIPEVEKKLADAGLQPGTTTRRPANGRPLNSVLEHSPVAGQQVPRGSRVNLTVAAAETVEVPNLRLRNLDDAQRELSSLNLAVGTVTRLPTTNQPNNTIIDTVPPQGQRVQRGARVDITVAITELILVPQLTGIELNAATQQLKLLGLSVGQIFHSGTGNQVADTVITTSPEAGQRVAPGSRVDITVVTPEPARRFASAVGQFLGIWRNRFPQPTELQEVRITPIDQQSANVVLVGPNNRDWGSYRGALRGKSLEPPDDVAGYSLTLSVDGSNLVISQNFRFPTGDPRFRPDYVFERGQ